MKKIPVLEKCLFLCTLQAGEKFPPAGHISLQCGMVSRMYFLIISLQITKSRQGASPFASFFQVWFKRPYFCLFVEKSERETDLHIYLALYIICCRTHSSGKGRGILEFIPGHWVCSNVS